MTSAPTKITTPDERGGSFYRIDGRMFDEMNENVSFTPLYSEQELTELRTEIDRVLPRSSEFEQGYNLAVSNGELIASKASLDLNEEVLDALIRDAREQYDTDPVKAYLRQCGVLS